jgi:hypothetical protein
MSTRVIVAWVVLALVALAVGPGLPSAEAQVSPNATYAASTQVSATPNSTLRYSITMTRTGTLSRLVLPLPPYAGTSGQSIAATNLRGAVLDRVRGGFVLRLTAPYVVAAGTTAWVMINGITTPPASTVAVPITALATNGTVMGSGTTPGLRFYAAPKCPSSWPPDHVATENALPGTTAWRLSTYSTSAATGYLSHTSARCGDTVTVRASAAGYQLAVTVYRMGYYGGRGARAVWASRTAVRGFSQPTPSFVARDEQGRTVNMPTARNWAPTLSIRIDGSYRPGNYLVKITDLSGRGSYVPLIVRDDTGHHDKLLLSSVATWQAYNRFGGYSAYTTPQSTRVSLDRPLAQNQGTGDFLSLEYGFVYWAEKQGFDLNYAADIDLHSRPYLYDNADTLVMQAHTEYWSAATRATADAGVAKGKKIASFGANQIYWRINPKPSVLTGGDREYEIFRSGDTSRFRDEPNPNPEQNLLGAMFGCMHMDGTATPNDSWLWQGVSRDPIPHLAQGEVDSVQEQYPIPDGLEVLTTIPLDACNRTDDWRADVVAVDHGGGGRVFNASTFSWNCMLHGSCPWTWQPTTRAQQQIGQATMNVFSWLDSGAGIQAQDATGRKRLAEFREQREGVLRPLSGMPPLEPPHEG